MLVAAQQLSAEGAQAMRAGRFADAERIYRQLVKQSPEEAGWHGNLGLALHSQGKYRQAVEALEGSLKLRRAPGLAAVLGIDYLKLGDACRAIAPLEESNRLEALADAYSGCKRYDKRRSYTRSRETATGRLRRSGRDMPTHDECRQPRSMAMSPN
ncbi:MAG: tetratricopeptide repeat protein [Bryobacteraceae bacterium]